ncbi:hypothetical protein PUNSTDRAFT_54858 [Punctularia strigosozonata HHB-11173 SS5]|uniref:uncharacterized protein n=1 Tax=Punctularia strigosozonata (strain HHB-11173) TaxID=741275 RepID=UPI000441807D|nr:uncharacterized protein PUNSTDRAFT_54858 [Punctularia strigosozonata HHB-11173 SS5]EIN05465.1 hypothetical protein PUNSTDRAFT_54858 [Punctularia strigosozonata HHB-11173 SS5]
MTNFVADTDNLPAYRPTSHPVRPLSESSFHLSTKGRPWATLKLSSRAADGPPVVHEGDGISGSVAVDLSSGESLVGVVVTLTGRLDSIVSGQHTFLSETKTLGSSDATLTRCSSDGSGSSFGSTVLKPGAASTKLRGQLSMPFSFELPRTVELSAQMRGKSPSSSFKLPPSFNEVQSSFSIKYHISVRLRKGILRFDSILSTPILFVPSLRPDPPSLFRQLALSNQIDLHGVEGDPEGWISFEPIKMKGKLFNSREVAVNLKLSLARPLCYVRGHHLQMMLQISSDDSQALELLSNPSAHNVGLLRNAHDPGSNPNTPVASHARPLGYTTWRRFVEPNNNGDPVNSRTLCGEFTLPEDIAPTMIFGAYRITYLVVMYPPKISGFVPLRDRYLLSESVKVATLPPSADSATTTAGLSLPPTYNRLPGS